MKPRIFIDTNVFIFAREFPDSNSAMVIDLLNQTKIEAVISEAVIKEVYAYFIKFYSKRDADLSRRYLLESCLVVPSEQVQKEIEIYKGKIKEKDLEQIAVVKHFEIKHLVAYDHHFEKFSEYTIPRDFIKLSGLKPQPTAY